MIDTPPPREVAALCVSPTSVYKDMAGVDAYDKNRSAWNYCGNGPIVAHPPCRGWSATTRHQVKEDVTEERRLGLWIAELITLAGGILEQPAHSHLFYEAELPIPGECPLHYPAFSIAVRQVWWGYPIKKSTWLYCSRIDPEEVHVPYCLHNHGRDRRRQQLMSRHQRSETTPEFARWLVNLARRVR